MKTFVTSDWHLGETRFELMGRPFSTSDEMINTLVANHNKLVAPHDLVYVIGDVLYQGADKDLLKIIPKFNGNKILIRGNHDRNISDNDFFPYFQSIFPEDGGVYLEVEDMPVKCFLTHYPTNGVINAFNLVGHIHSAWRFQKNMMNIGVDANHFYPTDLANIHKHYNAISSFYDSDVWIAHDEVNLSHSNRGVFGSRLSK